MKKYYEQARKDALEAMGNLIKQQNERFAAMTATVINAPTMLASQSAAAGFKASPTNSGSGQ